MAEPDYQLDPSLWPHLRKAVIWGLVVGLVALIGGPLVGVHFAPPLAVGIPLCLAVAGQLVLASLSDLVPIEDPLPARPTGHAGYFGALREGERQLSAANRDREAYLRNLRPVLAAIATDRLRHKYGVDARRNPAQAREILGEPLWLLTMTPVATAHKAPGISRRELTELISALEAL